MAASPGREDNRRQRMKILLIGNYPVDQQYSLLAFRNVLLKELQARGFEARVISPEPKAIFCKLSRVRLRKWMGYVDKLILFPRALRQAAGWADVVHLCEHSSAVYAKYLQNVPHIVTCHDMMGIRSALGEIPEWPSSPTGRIYQKMILDGLRQSKHVACISQTTQQDFVRISGVPASRTTLIYNGFFAAYTPMSESESAAHLDGLNLPWHEPYLMHIGHNSPTKNRLGLLKIFDILRRDARYSRIRLMMAGMPSTEELTRYIHEHQLDDCVHELVGLNNEQVRALYSRAQALIFPSLYEGFGLPIIEAQACGCPVFASNRAPMTEVGGDAAIYFDPTKPGLAARIIGEHLSMADRITGAGFENIRRFTTERMLDEYVAAYRQLFSTGRKRDSRCVA
jgi:glycosyltransferase involved in cell wall biosynthesis